MNLPGVLAIYKFEMHRFARTLWTGLAVPVITTSLYFIVFGAGLLFILRLMARPPGPTEGQAPLAGVQMHGVAVTPVVGADQSAAALPPSTRSSAHAATSRSPPMTTAEAGCVGIDPPPTAHVLVPRHFTVVERSQ